MAAENAPFVEFAEDAPIVLGTVTGSRMLEGAVVADFGSCVLDYLAKSSVANLLLNFENVTYLASSALSELIRINDAVVAAGGTLRVCGLSERIHQVFEIANFTKILEIQGGETPEHAAIRFKRSIGLAAEEDAWEEK